jgi:hypothetical protein
MENFSEILKSDGTHPWCIPMFHFHFHIHSLYSNPMESESSSCNYILLSSSSTNRIKFNFIPHGDAFFDHLPGWGIIRDWGVIRDWGSIRENTVI